MVRQLLLLAVAMLTAVITAIMTTRGRPRRLMAAHVVVVTALLVIA
jgi:hypothetical protein